MHVRIDFPSLGGKWTLTHLNGMFFFLCELDKAQNFHFLNLHHLMFWFIINWSPYTHLSFDLEGLSKCIPITQALYFATLFVILTSKLVDIRICDHFDDITRMPTL